MLSKGLIIFTLFLQFPSCLGQVSSPGFCPNLKTERNFNANLYSGVWYDYARYFTFFQVGVVCSTAIYTPNPDGSIQVVNRGVNASSGMPTIVRGMAFAPNQAIPGRLLVQLETSPMPGNYWVLATDYRNFALVYSCRDGGRPHSLVKREILWILTRRRGVISRRLKLKILRIIRSFRLNPRPLMRSGQRGCPRVH